MATRYINKPYEQMTLEEQVLVAGFRIGDRLTATRNLDMIVEEIHAGGFGVVAIGVNTYDSGRPDGLTKGIPYVLKGIRGDVESTEARANFAEEAFQWVRLWSHPNITFAYSLITIQNRLFLILDYLPTTLESRIGKVSQAQALQYAVQIATGLAFLHAPDDLLVSRGPIIHRDLKPANVLIGGDGVAQITDFGLVKTIESALHGIEHSTEHSQGILQTHAAGTPPYMAPEQWAHTEITPAVDIFAFGVMLCEMLTGGDHPWGWNRNWRDGTLMDNLAQHHPPRAITSGTAEWQQTIESLYSACLAPRPEERPTSEALVAGLKDVLYQQGIDPWVPTLVERTYPPIAVRLSNLGLTYSHMQRSDEAVVAYQRAIYFNPSYAGAWYNLGATYASMQHYDDSVAAYQRAIDLNPSDASTWTNLGVAYSEMQRYDDAVGAYQRAIDLNPSYATAWNNLGNTYNSMQHYDEAEVALKRAIALNPSNADAWYNLGNTYRQMQCYEDAVAAYQRAIDLNPSDADTWNNLGLTYGKMQRYDDAVVAFQRAIDLNPSFAQSWFNLGLTYFHMQRYNDAVVAFQRAIDLNPSKYEAWNNLGNIYFQMQQYAEAVAAYEQAIAINPSFALAWYNLGMTYRQMQRYDDAVAAYRRAIALNPSDASAWLNLSITIVQQGNPNTAIQTIDEGLQYCPAFTTLYQLKYLILSRSLHRPEEAAQVIADARVHGIQIDG